ncbi:hypothetical protein IJ098_03580 [Candidatus Saccharibacteria bacterium]|nr:hypothetical protein [Candidatus Saccharibacteria bacterium]
MDPKQTSPLGGTPGGGQEGQNPSSASAGANSGATPVFSSGTDSASAGTPASDQKMPGTLGAENLSTGANVSRTMESLNSKNQSETGTSVFSKHKFDRAEPDGSILIPESKGLFFRKSRGDKDNDVTGSMIAARGESADGLDPETRRKRRMLRIGGIVGGALAVILAVVIVVVLVVAPRKESGGESGNAAQGMNRLALAEQIESNQSGDLYDMEKMFAHMYAGDYAIYQIYNSDEESLLQKYTPALETLTVIHDELVKYANGYPQEEFVNRFRTMAEFIENRENIYEESLKLIDNFRAIIVNEPEGVRSEAIKVLSSLNDEKINTILSKVQKELGESEKIYVNLQSQNCIQSQTLTQTCTTLFNSYQESLAYVNSPSLIIDILDIVSSPIDYDSESYIIYNLDTLVVDLKSGSYEVTTVLNPIKGEIVNNKETISEN